MNKSELKQFTNEHGYKCSADVYDRLQNLEKDILSRAMERAHLNGRKTVQAKDL